MAYDDIRITELPVLQKLSDNDLFLIQDVTTDLAHSIDWNDLKNSIGTLANGIIFPLGTAQEPQIALGDYSSGIFADDFGTFAITTQAEKRFNINQAGTTEIINGNVVIGNFDRQCFYTLTVNNITRFNCFTRFNSDIEVGGSIDAGGNITGGGDLYIPGGASIGSSCSDELLIYAEIRALCNMDLKGSMTIRQDLAVKNNATIDKDVVIGTNCNNTLLINSYTHIKCDLKVDGNLIFGGDLLLEGSDIGIGAGCDSTKINLKGDTWVYCDFRVSGETYLEQNLFVTGNQFNDGNLLVLGDTTFGTTCNDTTEIRGKLVARCEAQFDEAVTIGAPNPLVCPGTKLTVHGETEVMCDLTTHEDLVADHNVTIGTDCTDTFTVKSTPTFECDVTMLETLSVAKDTTLGANLYVDGPSIVLGDPNRPCTSLDPNIIDLNGFVNIACDLKVGGDIMFGGNLGLGGALIALGEGCDKTDIVLNGLVTNKCDTVIEGTLRVLGATELCTFPDEFVNIKGQLNVDYNAFFDEDIYVNDSVYLSVPSDDYSYYQHCCPEDFKDSIPSPGDVGVSHTYTDSKLETCVSDILNIVPTHESVVYSKLNVLCITSLNDRYYYRAGNNDYDIHPQFTHVWGKMWAHSRVELNSYHPTDLPRKDTYHDIESFTHFDSDPRAYAHDTVGRRNESTTTTIRGKTYALCESDLNDPNLYRVSAGDGMGLGSVYPLKTTDSSFNKGNLKFDIHRMNTNIYGNLLARANVHLNSLTRDDFSSRVDDAHTTIHGHQYSINNVYLNDARNYSNSNSGDRFTKVYGQFHAHNKVTLNSNSLHNETTRNCSQTTTILGELFSKCSVTLNTDCNDKTLIKGELNSVCDVTLNTNCSNKTLIKGNQETQGEVRLNTTCGKDTFIYENCHIGANGTNAGKNLYVGNNVLLGTGGFNVVNGTGADRGNSDHGNDSQVLSSNAAGQPRWIDTVSTVNSNTSIDSSGSVGGDSGQITLGVNVDWLHNTVGKGAHTTKSTTSITATGPSYGGSGNFNNTEWTYTIKDSYVNGLIDNKLKDYTIKNCSDVKKCLTKADLDNIAGCDVCEGGDGSGGGGTTPPTGPVDWADIINKPNFCDPGWIEDESGPCPPEAPDENICSTLGSIWGRKLVLTTSGTGRNPAIAWGTEDTTGVYMGIGGSTSLRRIRMVAGDDWDQSVGCGGQANTSDKLELLTMQYGSPQGGAGADNWTNRTFKPRTMAQGSGGKSVKAKRAGEWASNEGITTELIYETTFRISNTDEVTPYNDTTLASFDVDSILDNLADGATATMDGGSSLIRWGKLNAEEMEYVSHDFINHVSPFIDLEQLQAIHPYLVKTEYTQDSYEPHYKVYDDGAEIEEYLLKPDPADRTLVPVEVNDDVLTLMLLARAKQARDRVQTLENDVQTLKDELQVMRNEIDQLKSAP